MAHSELKPRVHQQQLVPPLQESITYEAKLTAPRWTDGTTQQTHPGPPTRVEQIRVDLTGRTRPQRNTNEEEEQPTLFSLPNTSPWYTHESRLLKPS